MTQINNDIFYFFYNLAHQSKLLDSIIFFIANTLPYVVIVLALLFLLLHHEVFGKESPWKEFKAKWREIVIFFFSSILAWTMAMLLKLLIQSPRPFMELPNVTPLLTEVDFGFPSGHATFFMALGMTMFLNHRKIGYIFITFALIIGIARIMAGVHYPFDILGGFVLGTIIAIITNKFYKKS